MTIRILHQYHNNMYDAFQAWQTIADTKFLSYRVSKLPPDIPNQQPQVVGRSRLYKMYRPLSLWRLLPPQTDLLILKHVNEPINLVPYIICWLRKIPCAITIQQFHHSQSIPYRVYWYLLRLLLKRLDSKIIAMTLAAAAASKRHFPEVHYLPACIDQRRFAGHGSRSPSPDKLHVLCVSKFQARKNIPLLIGALAQLRQQYPRISFHLTIIGHLSEKPASQTEYTRIANLISQLDLAKHVSLKQNIPYQEMPTNYHQADIFILPAQSEPLGYSVLEAMAAGKAVLVSSDVGAASYIAPGKNGFLFKPCSTNAIAATVAQFCNTAGYVDTNMVSAFGRASLEQVAKYHSPKVFLDRFQQLFQTFHQPPVKVRHRRATVAVKQKN